MFWLRMCLVFCLGQSLEFQNRGVQGFFHMNPFVEAEEYHSFKSSSRNSRDFSNLQLFVHNDERNSNQMPEEFNNWGAHDISPLDVWNNHPASMIQFENQQEPDGGCKLPHSFYISHKNSIHQPSNFQEAMNSYHHNLWNFATVEEPSFSGRNHQKETNPHAGSSRDNESSSNNIQPMCAGDFFVGPNFDEFKYPDSSFVPQPHQDLEIPNHEKIPEYPDFHSMQSGILYSPHLSEISDRVYQNQDGEASELNDISFPHNYGLLNTDTAIDHRRNSINENLIFGTTKKIMNEKAQSSAEAEKSFTEKLNIIRSLNTDYSKCSSRTALQKKLYRDFSNQMVEELNNWGSNDISPLDVWNNHPESVIQFENQQEPNGGCKLPHSFYISHKNSIHQPSNFQEAMNSYHHNPWSFEKVEDSSFADQNNHKETYPHVGSSKEHKLSSKSIQPMYGEEIFAGNHANLVLKFNEFWNPESSCSFMHQPCQNLEIHHHEKNPEYPDSHSMKNCLLYSPHLSEIRDRFYQNQNREVSDLNHVPPSHNSELFHTGAAIDHRKNSINNEKLIFDTPKIIMSKEAQSQAEEENFFKEKLELISILNTDFSRCSRRTALNKISYRSKKIELRHLESIHKKAIDFISEHNLKSALAEIRTKEEFITADVAKINRLRKHIIFEYTLGIEWKDSKLLKEKINSFADNFKNYGNAAKRHDTPNHIKNISILGITFMKIISKKYVHDAVSEEFGNDQNLINYTESFWNCCFTNNAETNIELRKFFKSFGKQCSKEDVDKFLSTGFFHGHNIPENIFLKIKTSLLGKTDKPISLILSWYFVFFRSRVYYPQLILTEGYPSGSQLKTFIEDGIMYFFEAVESFH